ncbi:MAG: cofactor assembly of complex C subunit B [Leptolyngbyaceae bacterium]|nr:cofactor assembly of complex C subunit B [Leptolyngbyaceae bacterium]
MPGFISVSVRSPFFTMSMPVLSSTFFLTLLLMVGLFFFIRASTKDRTEVAHLISEQPQEPVLEQLQTYFSTRAYRIINIDAAKNLVTFEGFVRPSMFLSIFLSTLAAAGLLCIALVLSLQFPQTSPLPLGLVTLSPLAGVFYWKRAARLERVALQVEPMSSSASSASAPSGSAPSTENPPGNYSESTSMNSSAKTEVIVTAHRDEIIQLQRSLGLQREYI